MTTEEVKKNIIRGNRYLNEGEFRKALSEFRKALKKDPESAEAYFGMAESGMMLADTAADGIIMNYRRAMEIDPKQPLYAVRLGEFLLDMGRYEEAEQAYAQAAERDPLGRMDYLQEFGIEYFKARMAEFGDDDPPPEEFDDIVRRSLTHILQGMGISPEDAVRILSR